MEKLRKLNIGKIKNLEDFDDIYTLDNKKIIRDEEIPCLKFVFDNMGSDHLTKSSVIDDKSSVIVFCKIIPYLSKTSVGKYNIGYYTIMEDACEYVYFYKKDSYVVNDIFDLLLMTKDTELRKIIDKNYCFVYNGKILDLDKVYRKKENVKCYSKINGEKGEKVDSSLAYFRRKIKNSYKFLAYRVPDNSDYVHIFKVENIYENKLELNNDRMNIKELENMKKKTIIMNFEQERKMLISNYIVSRMLKYFFPK